MTVSVESASATAATPRALKRSGRSRGRHNGAGYLFLSPWLIGFMLLTAGPMLASLVLAFTNYNLFDSPKFIGVDNFTRMFTDPRWLKSVQVTAIYVFVGTPVKLAASLGVALLLNRPRKGLGFFRSAFYAPSLIGTSVSIAIVWKAMFADDGIVDQIQQLFGVDIGGWVGNPTMATVMMILLAAWQFGAPMVIFLAGLKQIPNELYEAASVDGAGPMRKFLSITMPMLSPVLFFNLLLEIIRSFQTFTAAYIIGGGNGNPAGATNFYALYLYIRGFSDYQMGYAAAMAWVLLAVVGVIAIALFSTSKSWVHYAGGE